MEKTWVKELEIRYEKQAKKGWSISCHNCEYLNKFKNHVGVYFREFCEILKGKCPECRGEIKLILDEKNNSITAVCENNHTYILKNLKNLKEEFIKDKEWAWVNIVPKCPECGNGCVVFFSG